MFLKYINNNNLLDIKVNFEARSSLVCIFLFLDSKEKRQKENIFYNISGNNQN